MTNTEQTESTIDLSKCGEFLPEACLQYSSDEAFLATLMTHVLKTHDVLIERKEDGHTCRLLNRQTQKLSRGGSVELNRALCLTYLMAIGAITKITDSQRIKIK